MPCRSRATLAKRAALLVAAAAVWITSAIFLWRTEVPHLQLDDLDPRAYFTAQELARIDDFRRVTRPLLVGSLILEAVILLLFVWKAGAITDALGGIAKGRIRTGVLGGGVAVGAVWLALLPLMAVSRGGAPPIWPFRTGLRRQLRDQAMSGRPARPRPRHRRRLHGTRGLARKIMVAREAPLVLAATLFVLAQPLVIDPLFNRFEPLEDRALAAKIEALGRQEEMTVSSVEVADASRRTPRTPTSGASARRGALSSTTPFWTRTASPRSSRSRRTSLHVDAAISGKASAGSPSSPFPCVFVVAWAAPAAGAWPNPEPCRSRSQSPSASSF